MYKENELRGLSISEIKEELRKTQQSVMYYEMADGQQYYREEADRNKTKQYYNLVHNVLKEKEEACQKLQKI